ncbi:MAG: hypothetical protein VYA34_17280 [Myxococcota bacterium]|nr:hypothetical protein [Myxococcota bacterium]
MLCGFKCNSVTFPATAQGWLRGLAGRVNRTFLLANISFLFLFSGCTKDFQKRSSLQEIRLLTLEASPLAVGPGEHLTVKRVLYVPSGESVETESWSFCPVSLGSSFAYQCAIDACVTELTPNDDQESVTFVPFDLAIACLQSLSESGVILGDVSGDSGSNGQKTAEFIKISIIHRFEAASGFKGVSVKELPQYFQAVPTGVNSPPVIESVSINGSAVTPGGSLAFTRSELVVEVVVNAASTESYFDQNTEVPELEEVTISFRSSRGAWEVDRRSGLETRNVLSFEEESEPVTELTIWLVVRDGRGGQSAFGPITLEKQAP